MSGILQALFASFASGEKGFELYAWGVGNNGRLGDNTTVSKSSPIQVGALTDWSQVSANSYHTASVKTDGTLWTWGENSEGQLGDGTIANRSSPVQVGALTNWSQVSTGRLRFTAAVKAEGTLWAWGSNSFFGNLGDNTTASKSSPVQVGALTNWYQVSAGGFHTAAVKTDGTLWAWGRGTNGNLGHNNTTTLSSPVQVGALTNWSQVSAGGYHTASVKTDGTLWAWGDNSPYGQLGDGTTVDRSSPVQIGALTNWSQVSAGHRFFTAAVKTDGTLWAWGSNGDGRLGDGTTASKSSPVQIGALTNWQLVDAGETHTVAVKTDGTLWSWGYNGLGQLGDGTTASKSSPVQIGALTNWSQAAAGRFHTAAVAGG